MRYCVIVLTALVCISTWVLAQQRETGFANKPVPATAKQQYEFKVLSPRETAAAAGSLNLDELLNEHGKEGWQVASTSIDGAANPPTVWVVLQRPK